MLISIITVCFNETDNLLLTLKNISNLKNYFPFEYILIDGKSKQETIRIIKDFEHCIDKLVSEQDEGLFDAMNKGVKLASGSFVNFLNCGDVLTKKGMSAFNDFIINPKNNEYDVYYLDTLIKYRELIIKQPKWSLNQIYKGMPFCHQSTFVKNKFLKKYPFDKLSLCGDFKFFTQLYVQGAKFKYIPEIGSIYQSGGVSEKNLKTSLKQKKEYIINLGYWREYEVEIFYRTKLLKANIRLILKRILGESHFKFIESKIQCFKHEKGSDTYTSS